MLDIVYRDDRLIAIDKPPGLLVHRSNLDRNETRFAVQLLRDQIGRRVYPLHRLDKGTSGVLLFALDADTARAVGGQFERNEVAKTYLAVVRGWPAETGTIDHPLVPPADTYADATAAEPQPAVTHFRRLDSIELPFAVDRYPSARYALLELSPQTGRRHQLRRHLKHIAHPIVGDATYGKGRHNRWFAEHLDCRRLLLAATTMRLRHPGDDRPLLLTAPLSGEFAQLLHRPEWSSKSTP